MGRRSFSLLAGLFVLVCGSVIYGTDWPKFHYDNANTGVSPDDGPGSNNIKWTYENNDRGNIDGPLAVVDGKVYCGDDDGWMYCFNAGTGAVIWEKNMSHSFGDSGPCVIGGKVYIGTDSGIIYCFNTSDGSTAWSYETNLSYPTSPVVYNDKVYVGVDKYIYCLDAANNGQLVWKFYTGSGDIIRNAPAIYNDRLYVSSDYKEVWCISLVDTDGNGWIDHGNSNELYWSYASHGGWSSPVVVNYNSHNYLFVARNGGGSGVAGVVCINIDTHAEHSYYHAGGQVWSTPVFSEGWLYFGSSDHKFYAYIFGESEPEWAYDAGKAIQCSPALSANNHRVYFTAGNYNLYCFRAYYDSADMIWSDTSHCYTDQCPTVADGVLYVAGCWCDLNAYGESSGNSTVNAYCYPDGQSISVPISMNGSPTGFNTPHIFIGVDPNTTFSVPPIDANGHPFKKWSTNQFSRTINVTNIDTYTAYYEPSQCYANLDGLNSVDFSDLKILADYWLSSDPYRIGDLDNSGTVNLFDFAQLARHWMETCNLPYPACWDAATQCHGDANGDGIVDELDETILIASFRGIYPCSGYSPCADFNRDGRVDINDWDILQTNWRTNPNSDCLLGGSDWPPQP
jgi:outer membrane protein assembly factor BamB